jgi:hypothetical protein
LYENAYQLVFEKVIPIPWIPPEFRGIGMEAELKFENIEEVEWNRNFQFQ